MTFVAFNSPKGRHMKRAARVLEFKGSPRAVAVHLVFDATGYVVNKGSLYASMEVARKLAHKIMEEYDASPRGGMNYPATLRPITLEEAQTANNVGGLREYRQALWTTATFDLDHMNRVRALAQLACLAGMLTNNDD